MWKILHRRELAFHGICVILVITIIVIFCGLDILVLEYLFKSIQKLHTVVSNTIIVNEDNGELTHKYTFQNLSENEDDESLRRELGSPSYPDFFPTPKLQRKGAPDNFLGN